ncbi:MAG TPA: LLM class flavin-dependent oxidoreductase [Myxococcota bacterium]|nr:LLM class flavin-dependent oxidoreductase [Myxococcales bacterium]HPG27656.1 LLM class flavin-dependent oxidoreductase [Myxococcota bacterium]
MQLGLLMFPSPRGSADVARLLEELGFDSLVFADTQCLTPEVWSQLMLAATATDRIEIGPGVTNPVSRDAAVTASAAVGLQIASGGRVVLGIGRGDSSMAKIGKRPAPPAEFERYLERLRGYMDGEVVDRDGHESRLEWLDECEVPYVPIEVAATGPKVIDLAARRADRICFAVGADLDRLRTSIARARMAAEAAGRRPDALELGAYVNCVVHPDRSVARQAIRGGLASFATFSGFAGMDLETLPEGVRDAARHLRQSYDMTHHGKASSEHAQSIDDDFVHRFGIAGPVEEAVERFAALRDLGLDFVRVVPGSRDMDTAVRVQSVQAIAKHVLPAVASR